jgi:uncharacterized protein
MASPETASQATAGRTRVGLGFTDGGAGMASQVRGLLRAAGASEALAQAPLKAPWKWLWPGVIPNRDWIFQSPQLVQPLECPDLVVTSGRQSIMASLALKRRFGDRVFTVHTQDPRISPSHFDLVACPKHDGLTGPNVVGTFGAIHHITPELLAEAVAKGPVGGLERLTRPFVLVLRGGPTRNYAFSPQEMSEFQDRLASAARDSGRQLAIVPSKRTPKTWVDSFLARFGRDHCVWTGQGDNPYLAGLALSSHIVVTCDSVNMISEAAATRKPVYAEMMSPRRESKRFLRFHESFERAGISRPFEGALDQWDYTPPNATGQIADAILERMQSRSKGSASPVKSQPS